MSNILAPVQEVLQEDVLPYLLKSKGKIYVVNDLTIVQSFEYLSPDKFSLSVYRINPTGDPAVDSIKAADVETKTKTNKGDRFLTEEGMVAFLDYLDIADEVIK